MCRFHHEISDVGLPCPLQIRKRSSLQIHYRGFSASNTVLLTCVMGQLPLRSHPTFSQTFSAMAGFRPGESNRFGVTSRAQHRFVSAFRPSSYTYPALEPGFAESACITVLIQLYKETHLEIVSPDEKGQPFSTVSVLSLSYPNGGHFASCFLCAACICLQKRNGPWAVPFFVIRRSSE